MLNHWSRNAYKPIQEYRNLGSRRCAAFVATETDCPADDCGWDEFGQSAKKTDCLTCGGRGKVIDFLEIPFRATAIWGAERFQYIKATPGIELGDVILGIARQEEWIVSRVLEHQRSYFKVDGQAVRPLKTGENIIPGIGEGLLVNCKLFGTQ